jgi:hypothetical protein
MQPMDYIDWMFTRGPSATAWKTAVARFTPKAQFPPPQKIRAGVSAEGPRNPGLSCPPPQ